MLKTLFTIGHSTHPIAHFIALLQKYRVEQVWDVRSVPYSRHNPHFNRESLTESLQTAGVLYSFLGKELGARSNNPDCYVDGRVQYNCLAEQPGFVHALKRLKKGIEATSIALMCAEADPVTCHRTILVCRELRMYDLEIQHILGSGLIETQDKLEDRLMSITRTVPDMFHAKADCVEAAYDRQAKAIAYKLTPETPPSEGEFRFDEDFHYRIHE